MLINASRFTRVHEEIMIQVKAYLQSLERQIEFNPNPFDEAKTSLDIQRLMEIFDKHYNSYNEISFTSISKFILKVLKKIDVVCVNRENKKQLTYEGYLDGRTIIAVGGMSLSRGLTLERLLVSYYSRTSRDYDTMLQMGRWFGYRSSYQKYCRLFLSNKNHDHYKFLAESFDELCGNVSLMNRFGQTPMDFALKVRLHPLQHLMVTARRKRGAAIRPTKTITYSGQLKQNYAVSASESDIASNINLYRSFVQLPNLGSYKQFDSRHFVFNSVALDHILMFIENYKYANHPGSIQIEHLIPYIRKESMSYKIGM